MVIFEPLIEEVSKKCDFLILGQHYIKVKNKYKSIYNVSEENYLDIYFSTAHRALSTGLFKIFAHPDIFLWKVKDWNPYLEKKSKELIECAIKNNVLIELNANGACLDYRVFIHNQEDTQEKVVLPKELENSKAYDGGETVFGYFTDTVAGTTLTFDYDWKAHGSTTSEVKDEFWYFDVFLPWSDFGLAETPKEKAVWKGTINRIDSSLPRGTNQGFLCLLDEPEIVSFHQPKKFASFSFQNL